MKDSRIDQILNDHINDYNVTLEKKQIETLLGDSFVLVMSKNVEEVDLAEMIEEAKLIMIDYLKENKLSSPKENSKVILYKQCLLQSFLLRPDYNIEERKLYIDAYLKAMQTTDTKEYSDVEEEITNKAILWYQEYKQEEHDLDPEDAFEIAILAINDQVYSNMFEEKPKEKIFKNKIS